MAGQMIGFVGVGRMGGPMAARLLDAGHSLTIFDTSAEALAPLKARGATVAASAHEVANSAEVVMMSLPTPPLLRPQRRVPIRARLAHNSCPAGLPCHHH